MDLELNFLWMMFRHNWLRLKKNANYCHQSVLWGIFLHMNLRAISTLLLGQQAWAQTRWPIMSGLLVLRCQWIFLVCKKVFYCREADIAKVQFGSIRVLQEGKHFPHFVGSTVLDKLVSSSVDSMPSIIGSFITNVVSRAEQQQKTCSGRRADE